MKGKGPKSERETIIRFDEEESIAYIWTASAKEYRSLLRLGYEPIEDLERSASFKIPKKCVSIRKPVATSEKKLKALEKARTMTKARSDQNPLTVQGQNELNGVSLGDS